jgi:hypothetical protein
MMVGIAGSAVVAFVLALVTIRTAAA